MLERQRQLFFHCFAKCKHWAEIFLNFSTLHSLLFLTPTLLPCPRFSLVSFCGTQRSGRGWTDGNNFSFSDLFNPSVVYKQSFNKASQGTWHRPLIKARFLCEFRQSPAYTPLPLPKSCTRLGISLWAACSLALAECRVTMGCSLCKSHSPLVPAAGHRPGHYSLESFLRHLHLRLSQLVQTPLVQLPKFSRQGENNTDCLKCHGRETHWAIFHLIFILSFVLPSLNLMESTGILHYLKPGHWILAYRHKGWNAWFYILNKSKSFCIQWKCSC